MNHLWGTPLLAILLSSSAFAVDTSSYLWTETQNETFHESNSNADCYTMNPECEVGDRHLMECPEFSEQLKNLDKCTWNVWKGSFVGTDSRIIYDPSLVSIEDGVAHFRMDWNDDHTKIRIGAMDTLGDDGTPVENTPALGFRQTYGRFEVYAKVDTTKGAGSWPAAWLNASAPVSVNGNPEPEWTSGLWGWPYDGELDILEYFSKLNKIGYQLNQFVQTYHFGDKAKEHDSQYIAGLAHIKNKDDFHLYAVEWTRDFIQFETDGEIVNEIPRQSVPQITDKPMYWILNNGFQMEYFSHFEPQDFQVKSVRSYQLCTNSVAQHCVKKENLEIEITPYPNPVKAGENLNLKVNSNRECSDLRIRLFDLQGQLTVNQTFSISKGEQIIHLQNPGLRPGLQVGVATPRGCTLVNESRTPDLPLKIVVE